MSGRPRPFHQHDLLVPIAALALLAIGGLGYHSLTAPRMSTYEQEGLSFSWPGNWLPREEVEPAPPRLLGDISMRAGEEPVTAQPAATFHEVYSYAPDSELRLEVRIAKRPRYGNLRGVLSFERRNRYGELYRQLDGKAITIGGHDWLQTRYQYAYKPERNHAPITALGVEYATLSGDKLYVVTIHGGSRETKWLAGLLAPTLMVPPDGGASPLSPMFGAGKRINSDVVKRTLPSVVMVMAVDLQDGALVPVSSGSGSVISTDGSILTNFHVVHNDERQRLHDLFVIGRFRGIETEPEYVCAGRPNRSKLLPELDLALIKCDLDMDGHAWTPSNWPAVPIELTETAVHGERVWVIGYPDVAGGTINASTGEVTGLVQEDGTNETAFLVTTAAITYGGSGGAAIDENGVFIGVPTAFRSRARVDGASVTRLGDEGLIRPVQRAEALLSIAQAGWTPTLGDNRVDDPVDPATIATELPSGDPGVEVSSVVRDEANGNAVPGAVVIVFRPGVRARDVDLNRLLDTTLTWGRTDEHGHFTLRRPVPRGQSYSVAVLAKGYQPLIESNVLVLDAASPSRLDPWGTIHLQR